MEFYFQSSFCISTISRFLICRIPSVAFFLNTKYIFRSIELCSYAVVVVRPTYRKPGMLWSFMAKEKYGCLLPGDSGEISHLILLRLCPVSSLAMITKLPFCDGCDVFCIPSQGSLVHSNVWLLYGAMVLTNAAFPLFSWQIYLQISLFTNSTWMLLIISRQINMINLRVIIFI